ncbi:MAG: hypothetical protein GXO83_12915 [Chlorobi bacterium]|nr:hypothetical protein [Chlorobiota bacterium]
MTFNRFIPFVLILILSSCQKEKPIPLTGEVTMDSTLFGSGSGPYPYYLIGFSFSQGKLIEYRNGNVPDITILPKTEVSGNVKSAFLDTPNVFPSFSLTAAFDNADDALTFFGNYLEAADSGYISLADPILPHQIWTFKTATGRFAKMLIMDVKTMLKDQVPYAEVTFRYVYQPDGTPVFQE